MTHKTLLRALLVFLITASFITPLCSEAGTVEEESILGGNPVLADAAVRAVKKWKYVQAPSKSSTRVDFVFNPYK